MPDDFEEAAPAKKKKGKTILTRKRLLALIMIARIFSLGAAFQKYYVEPYIEPLFGETLLEKYTRCLTQKEVLDERFVSCMDQVHDLNNLHRACEYNLKQCQQV